MGWHEVPAWNSCFARWLPREQLLITFLSLRSNTAWKLSLTFTSQCVRGQKKNRRKTEEKQKQKQTNTRETLAIPHLKSDNFIYSRRWNTCIFLHVITRTNLSLFSLYLLPPADSHSLQKKKKKKKKKQQFERWREQHIICMENQASWLCLIRFLFKTPYRPSVYSNWQDIGQIHYHSVGAGYHK